MDIPKLNQTPAQPTAQSGNTADILGSLRRLGAIDATVLRIEKGEVLLATRLGEIIGKNALDLKTGDQLRIRIGGLDTSPVLKVTRQIAKPIILNTPGQTALTRALVPNQLQTAMVVVQTPESIGIRLNGNRHTINQQVDVKTGQLISLNYRPDKNHIEIKPVDTGQVLKSALTRLLPQAKLAESSNSLVSLVKILQSLASHPRANQSTTQFPASLGLTNSLPQGNTAANTNLKGQEGAQTQLITRLVSMLQSLPKISTLDRVVIQQWAGFLSSAKNVLGIDNPNLENPFSLLKQIPTNEASLRPLLQQWARQILAASNFTAHSKSNLEAPDNESYSNVAKDILKLVEQSINQHQFQQTSVRYQQEQQQPINFSLTIPVTEDESARPLNINIRERKSSAVNEDNAWDIDLNFEFGQLGLISSHITVDGNLISTTFWANQEDTRLKIDRALPEFKQQLLTAGFEPGQFFSLAGPAPTAVEQVRQHFSDTLLDIKV